jgi:hypothetical protein
MGKDRAVERRLNEPKPNHSRRERKPAFRRAELAQGWT